MEIRLLPPVENFRFDRNVSQMFGVNFVSYNTRHGTYGHNALDIVVQSAKMGYGSRILAAHDGVVVARVEDSHNTTKGHGIYLHKNMGDKILETIYWHLSDFRVDVGERVRAGQTIGLMGNTGYVRPRPTPKYPWLGTHVHFGVRLRTLAKEVINYKNGFFGFIDPTPLLYTVGNKLPIRWKRNLFYRTRGNDVAWLQTVLKIEGFAEDYEPTGMFYWKTRRDVIRLQKKYFIVPAVGFYGPKTRSILSKYSS